MNAGFQNSILSPSHYLCEAHQHFIWGKPHFRGNPQFFFHLSAVTSFLPGHFIITNFFLELWHYYCYFICGFVNSTTLPEISLFSTTSINITQLPVVPKRRGLQTPQSIVPTKNNLEISTYDSDF